MAAALRRVAVGAVVIGMAVGGAGTAGGQCPTSAWVPGIGTPGIDGTVRSLAVLPGGDLIVGGFIYRAGGAAARNIVRYSPTTGAWSALGVGVGDHTSGVYALAVLPNGDLLAGGSFTVAGGVVANRIARYNPVTGTWSALGSGVDSDVRCLAVLPDGEVIAGGFFTTAGGVPGRIGIARYNPTTEMWSGLGSGVEGGSNPNVVAVAILPGGDVIAGGYFLSAGGVPATKGIARYNPTTGVWSALGSGLDGTFYAPAQAIALLPSGDVIVGGFFATAGGVAANNIARYDPTTGVWSALGSGVSSEDGSSDVEALAVLPNGDVIVAGRFATAGGVEANSMARYNPVTGLWSAPGLGTERVYSVDELAVLPNGDVIVAGNFLTAGGVASNHIARYHPGPIAPTFVAQPQNGRVCRLAGSATLWVLAAGTDPFTYQWRKDTVPIDAIANPSAATMELLLDNVRPADLAGSYDCVVTNVCGSVTSDAATIIICIGDFNCDGGIDGGDVESFFGAWEVGDAAADVNEDGGVNGADVEFLFVRWEGGC